jgi:hypothetical protein
MTDTSITDNVTPLPVKTERRDSTAALRQRRSREKRKRTIRATVAQTAQLEKPSGIKADVTVAHSGAHAVDVTAVTPTKRTNYALVAIAYGFFALGIGINVWNAMAVGTLTDMVLPAALGVLAVVFFLPAWALTLPIGRQVLAWVLFAFISVFTLTNSLRMASIIAADQMTARAGRQTEGVRVADQALDVARAKRDEALQPWTWQNRACKVRQAEVTKLEAAQTQTTDKVVTQARPESTDFAKLVTWGKPGRHSARCRGFRNVVVAVSDVPASGWRARPDAGKAVVPTCHGGAG